MADNQAPEGTSALSQDEGTTIPRIKLSEQGFIGMPTMNGRILAETNQAFQYPYFHKTVNEIRHNPTVGAAMNVYRMMMSRVNWKVEPPEGADDTAKERARIVATMQGDMEHSWRAFIEEVVPYLEYGFDIHEKVLRRRLHRNGSKYNDGLVGIKKLAPRNQDTIERWVFSDDGSDLVGVEQNINNVENSFRFQNRKNENGLIPLTREKFLLFTASGNRGNPQGHSIYKAIYLAYKVLSLLQEQEMVALAKDVQGIMKIGIPPKYLSPDASPEDQAVAQAFQGIIDNYNAGTQRGLLVPNMMDDNGNALFTYELMVDKGSAKYDMEAIITRLQSDILSALNVDILKLGQSGTGSFSLASAKTTVLALAIDYRLREVADVLNRDLMRTIYEVNGWSCESMAKFVYEDIEDIDIEAMGKFLQQTFSVGAVEVDRPVMNRVRGFLGVPAIDENSPVDKDKLAPNMTSKESKAGEGMKTAGDGTSKSPMGAKDSSAANSNNK
ncbi:MAG: phage portal protein family protein [Halobacteriota archaeon]